MAHTRAADDFQAIRARMKELRCERERAVVTETDGGSVQRSIRQGMQLSAKPHSAPDRCKCASGAYVEEQQHPGRRSAPD